MRTPSTLAAIGALLALASAPAARRAPAPSDLVALVCPEEGYLVVDLIRLASEVTGEPFLFEPREVSELRVFFAGTWVATRDQFLVVFDRLIDDAGCLHLESSGSGQRVHTICPLGRQGRRMQNLRDRARFVTPDEALELGDREVLVTTALTLETLRGRDVSDIVCIFSTDMECQFVHAMEGTRTVIMMGQARRVARSIRILRDLDFLAHEERARPRRKSLEERIATLESGADALVEAAGRPTVEEASRRSHDDK